MVMEKLFLLYDAMEGVRAGADAAEILDVHHESMIHDPRAELTRCREFLGLAEDPAWLESAAGVVLPSPRGGRERVEWTEERTAAVEERIARHDFLAKYRR